ncbi:MAG: sigma-70 family RNA polymerase sigma factor [Bryobacteraceae bacterium]|nr:sigma-70 family RNA polymerase sigma factor [Bryobacteraceae bacterium]
MIQSTFWKGPARPVSASVPELIARLRTGDESALGELTPTLYGELRRIASRHLRGERSNHTLQATALVHEAYLKLIGARERQFADEVHFLAVASRVMRQVLVDYARSRSTQKRAGGARVEPLWTTTLEVKSDDGMELIELIELDQAIEALAAENEPLARLIEMRYFGGMTAEESAEALGLSVHVVRHDLRFAQAWLRRKLSP